MSGPKLTKAARQTARSAMVAFVKEARITGAAFRLQDLQLIAARPIARAENLPVCGVRDIALFTANNFLRKQRKHDTVRKGTLDPFTYFQIQDPV